MLKLTSCMLALVLASTPLACVPSFATDERYEFLGGETICIDADRVVERKVTAIFGGGQKVVSLSVRPNAIVLRMEADRLLNLSYYLDLATFIETHPDSVRRDSSEAFYELDVAFRPPAEVDSMRLRDRLMPGDGSMSILVSKSIRNLRDDSRGGDDLLADIFLAMCWSNGPRSRRCERIFPFLGFRVSYPMLVTREIILGGDQELRSHLEKVVRRCP